MHTNAMLLLFFGCRNRGKIKETENVVLSLSQGNAEVGHILKDGRRYQSSRFSASIKRGHLSPSLLTATILSQSFILSNHDQNDLWYCLFSLFVKVGFPDFSQSCVLNFLPLVFLHV